MMNDVNTTQKQTQEQKTVVKSMLVGDWISSLVGWGILVIVMLVVIGVSLWVFDGVIGQAIDITVLTLTSGCLVWVLGHYMARQWYQTQRVKLASHFFVEGVHCVGDYTTLEYRHFPVQVTMLPDVKQEIEQPTVTPYRPDTWEELNDRAIYEKKKAQGKTWQEIIDSFDPELKMTMAKVRAACDRHAARIAKGEITE